MTQKRIWPSLTVLSAVAACGVALCCSEELSDAGRSLQQWLATANTAQACDACSHGGASLPVLRDLSEECPFLLADVEPDVAGPKPAASGAHPGAEMEPIQQATALDMAADDSAAALELKLQPPQINHVQLAVATTPPATESTNSQLNVKCDSDCRTPNGRRDAANYVTRVSHKSPTVVAARPLVKCEAETSAANAVAVPIKASRAADGSITKPLPPAAPSLLQPIEMTSASSTELSLKEASPDETSAASPAEEDNTTFRGQLVKHASATPRAFEPTTIQSAETLPTAISGKQSGVGVKWTLPDALTMGQGSICHLQLNNAAETAAQDVTVTVHLSAGVRVENAVPRPTSFLSNAVTWELGDVAAGASPAIQIVVVPEAPGEFAPTARVTCTRSLGAKAPIVEPRLEMTIEGPREAVVGQPTPFHVRVANDGTGSATGIEIELQLAEGLEGAAGFKSSYAIGTLAPGESRQVQVVITGHDQGDFDISGKTLLGEAENATCAHTVRMIRPSLAVAMEGPKLRFVDRKAEYVINVKNPGPGPIENVQLMENVPAGFRFVDATSGGAFDQQTRQVAWFVGHLEPNESANVALHLVAVEAGEHRLVAEAKADFGVAGGAEATTTIRGAPRVVLDVTEDDDPVEVDGETIYRIRLTNSGSLPAHGVQFAGEAPREMEVLKVSGPVEGLVKGRQVVFPPVETLAPGETVSYEVHVKCLKAGQVQFRAYFRSKDNATPVLEEEMTRIYGE